MPQWTERVKVKPVGSKPATDTRKLRTETGRKGMEEHGHEPLRGALTIG